MMKKWLLCSLTLCVSFAFADTPTSPLILLDAVQETLIVDGRPAKVFDIIQPDGTEGYTGVKGQDFNVILKNDTRVPISIHWHGLVMPNDQDGVPYVTQLPIMPGHTHHYNFKLTQAGTFWMHSHLDFHEQELMTAPLVIKDPQDSHHDDKDITVMFQGFTFSRPENIFDNLKHPSMMASMKFLKKNNMNIMQMMSAKPDLNDVIYDDYLANRKTLQNPDVYTVKPGDKIRLRLINASSATNFWIYTGALQATAIAVDGNDIIPLQNTAFQLADAQRIDLEVTIPKAGGVFPIFAQVEGLRQHTGIILATPGAKIPVYTEQADKPAPALNDSQELQLHALQPLPARPNSISLPYKLTGNMMQYIWMINNEVWPHINPKEIKQGDRVELVFTNDTGMAHPMHFHGHVFQVTEINGKKLKNGPLRDTVLVLPHTTKKVVFDANNPGIWMLHCHVLYHMMAGMMTTLNYLGFPEPEYYKKLIMKGPES